MQVHRQVIQIASLYVCNRVICRPIGIRHSEKNSQINEKYGRYKNKALNIYRYL